MGYKSVTRYFNRGYEKVTPDETTEAHAQMIACGASRPEQDTRGSSLIGATGFVSDQWPKQNFSGLCSDLRLRRDRGEVHVESLRLGQKTTSRTGLIESLRTLEKRLRCMGPC